ncbi:MAG TPA: ISL3 family transposase [Chthonomonadaceae bacterium]|nr:ISL3 family transposase [Chthonomonadaceae bacterium]
MFDFLALPGVSLVKEPPESINGTLTLRLTTCGRSAICPACHHRSRRIHSHYQRTLADLPLGSQKVCLLVRVHRFVCVNPACSRRTFAEPLPEVVARYARRTQRLQISQTKLSQAVGSRPGARLAIPLGLPTSPTTVLRLERAAPVPTFGTPRVLRVDAWAFKKGQRYGTILVDLERHHVIDLLPDRTADSLAAWLRAHPGVEIISRGRGGCYAEGAREGAPHAVQVADRFHLLKNIGDMLERLLVRQHRFLREATHQAQGSAETAQSGETSLPAAMTPPPDRPLTRAQQQSRLRRACRVARYERAVALQQQGMSQREIARTLSLSRNTIRKWLDAGCYRPRCPVRNGQDA